MSSFTPLKKNSNTQSSLLRSITLEVDAVGGINLGQGVCNLPVPDLLIEAAQKALIDGHNRYTPAQGILSLREVLSHRLKSERKIPVSPETIAITHGSTGAWETICHAFLDLGDEVILFEPNYPYHRKAAEYLGAVVKTVHLNQPDWNYNSDDLQKAFSDRTKLVVVCTPNNPTGKIFSEKELLEIGKLCQKHNALLISDEVYEYMVNDGLKHISAASLPEIQDYVLTIGSYSKTFACTGWRVGYLVAPEHYWPALRVLLDRLYVCAPSPFQHAICEGILNIGEQYYMDLQQKYEHKRNKLFSFLKDTPLRPTLPNGAYYLNAWLPEDTKIDSLTFVRKMIAECGVAAIPGIEFVQNPQDGQFLRFCYSQPDEVLAEVGDRLKKLSF